MGDCAKNCADLKKLISEGSTNIFKLELLRQAYLNGNTRDEEIETWMKDTYSGRCNCFTEFLKTNKDKSVMEVYLEG